MKKSKHIHIIKVDIETPQSPSKDLITRPTVHAFNCCQSLIRVLLERMIIMLLLVVVFGFLFWYIFTIIMYTKHGPDFQIHSAWVNTSAVHDQFEGYVRADWTIVMSTRNPNERTPIIYKKVSVRMSHQLDEFGPWSAISAPFRQEPRNQTTLTARSKPLSKGTKLQFEILEPILEFNLTIQVDLSYKCRTCLREGVLEVEVFCPQVIVFLTNDNGLHGRDGRPRSGKSKSQHCSVRSKRRIHKSTPAV